jgi:HEPN domain-containing protein
MSKSYQEFRELCGFTYKKEEDNWHNWFSRAEAFKETAILIQDNKNKKAAPAYFYNAAISIELILKAILVASSKSFNKSHKLNELAITADVTVTLDQKDTLELLSEIIEWRGRYPIPTKEGRWHNYFNIVHEKHMTRQGPLTRGSIKTFPYKANYLKLWDACEGKLLAITQA